MTERGKDPRDQLGRRMKAYESEHRNLLGSETIYVIRLDGKNFSQYTKGLMRPFDAQFAADMDTVTRALCEEISGTVLAYTQSDEISVIFHAKGGVNTQPHMGGNIPKILSLSAARASVTFNRLRPGKEALFDARVIELPDAQEALNYLIWRQRDAERNSVQMAARTFFSHRELDKVSVRDAKAKLTQAGEPWEALPKGFRQGRLSVKVERQETVTFRHGRSDEEETVQALRKHWETRDADIFGQETLELIESTIK